MARPAASEPQSQMTILVPTTLKDWLTQRASDNDRSLNREVARLLQETKCREDGAVASAQS